MKLADDGALLEAYVKLRAKAADNFESEASASVLPGLNRIAGDMAGVFAGKKIFDIAKAGFEELGAAEKVTAQTTVTLKNLGSTAGVTMDDVDKLSESMLKQSGVDDELAKAAENVLLRVGVTGESFKRATQDSNDLAVAMGTDMKSAAETLGQALAHPERAAKLLKPAIGGLTDAQKESIKAFQANNDVAGAQGVVFDALEAKVKGQAEAFGKTLPGQMAIAKESMTNMKAELVAGMAPALAFGAQGVTFLTDEFDKLPEGAKTAIGSIGLVSAGVVSLARPVGDVVRLFSAWKDRSHEVTAATSALAAAEGTEAAASAAGAASSATATAVTISGTAATNAAALAAAKRAAASGTAAVADGEAALAASGLVGTEAEVTAAMIARTEATLAAATADGEWALASSGLVAAEATKATVLNSSTAVMHLYTEAEIEAGVAGEATAGKTGSLGSAIGKAGLGLAAAAGLAALYSYGQGLNKTSLSTDELTKVTKMNTGQMTTYFAALTEQSVGPFSGALDDAIAKLVEMGPAGVGTLVQIRDHLKETGQDTSRYDAAITGAKTAQDNLNTSTSEGTDALATEKPVIESAADAFKRLKSEISATDTVQQGYANTLKAETDPFFALVDAADKQAAAQANVWVKTAALDEAVRKFGRTSKEAGKAQDELTAANFAGVRSAGDLTQSQLALERAVANGTTSVDNARWTLATWVSQGLITQEQADQVAGKFDELKSGADALNGTSISIALAFDAQQAEATLKALLEATGSYAAQAREAANTPGASVSGGGSADKVPSRARASGGSVFGGETFTGAEVGAELLVSPGRYTAPPQGGFVLTAEQTAALLAAGGSQRGEDHFHYTIVAPSSDPHAIVDAAAREHRRLSIMGR